MDRKPMFWRYAFAKPVFVIALLSGLFCGVAAPAAGEQSPEGRLIDHVSFDRSAGETPGLLKLGPAVETGRGPASLEAKQRFIRFAEDGAQARFELKCDSDKQTYLTVKIWGGSGAKDAQLLMGHEGGPDITSRQNIETALTWQRTSNPLPGRFYYATRPIPKTLTEGETSVEVTLGYKAKGDSPLEVYNVYSHTDPYFTPAEDELQGEPFELGPPRRKEEGKAVTARQAFEHWKAEANEGFEQILTGNYSQKEWDDQEPGEVQIFGEKYKRLIEQGKIPAWTYGAILARRPGLTKVPHPYSTFDSQYKAWGGILIETANMNPGTAFSVLRAMAHAYESEWSPYYQDEEVLKRFAAAMDFYSKAQGAGGVWQGPKLDFEGGGYDGYTSWIGAPDRKAFQGQLFSMGQKNLWPAYNMLHDDLEAEGLLEKTIDHDLKPDTPEITRRKAYGKMPLRGFDFFKEKVLSRGVTNQVLHNYEPLWQLYEVLKKTNPKAAAEKRDEMRRLAEVAAGARRNPGPNLYLFSPKGLINEGGYSTKGYGSFNVRAISEMAKYTGFDFVKKRARAAFEAYSHFYYLGNDKNGHRALKVAEWITRRNESGFPGSVHYLTSRTAAKDLAIPAAIRHFELHEAHNRGIASKAADLKAKKPLGAYGNTASATFSAAQLADEAWEAVQSGEELVSLPPTNYRLPAERRKYSAFVDEHIESMALRYKDATLFVRFYWPNGNTRAIIRYMTPEFDRLVSDVPVRDGGPEKRGKWFNKTGVLKTFRYGPFFIVLNDSEEKRLQYKVPEAIQGKAVLELQTGDRGVLRPEQEISPRASRAFVVPSMMSVEQ